ncbi:MAG: hypothetical protein ACD_46C00535G0002 [uncultured bacterium]|nr:MAG: hypothetical protein ACD_46C00535G0002 [uncultured bacterium]
MIKFLFGLLMLVLSFSAHAKIYFDTRDCYTQSKNNIMICIQNNTNENIGKMDFQFIEKINYAKKPQQINNYVTRFFMPSRYIDISTSTYALQKNAITKIDYSIRKHDTDFPGCAVTIHASQPKQLILHIEKNGTQLSCK